ncbi:MAG: DUF2330 domain-containing protein [Deltaproteobacteria bacterium]|nr:DUF2330 domain-containing protein [Deltaproteobacteria bacterium]
MESRIGRVVRGQRGLLGLVGISAAAAAATFVASSSAEAFCGFYVAGSNAELVNNATQVALMRKGIRTVLTMSNSYQGPAEDFAMVVPVPVVLQQEQVKTLPHDVFRHIEELTSPRLVEYWEQDPCRQAEMEERFRGVPAPAVMAAQRSAGAADSLGVTVEAEFVVGEYQIVILSAQESTGLETWLHQNRYNIPRGAAEYLAPYVREQSKFFVARVDIERVRRNERGQAQLSPLRFHYDSQDLRLPVRLGLLNAGDAQDLIVYVLSPQSRFEVANYTNVFVPTNIDVLDNVRRNFGGFYAELFDATIRSAGGRAVVTEYSWSTSSCDPCPTPPLTPNELASLGLDVLDAPLPPPSSPPSPTAPGGTAPDLSRIPGVAPSSLPPSGMPMPAPPVTIAAPPMPPGGRFFRGGFTPMVVTRLHTRYNRATLTEDLVFREAPSVVGGREFVVDPETRRLEQGARVQAGGVNNFQARYAIRHPWTGPVSCANPRRGIWGGPPNGAEPRPTPARDLANVARGQVRLAESLTAPIPGIVPDLVSSAQAQPPSAGGGTTTTPATSGKGSCACRAGGGAAAPTSGVVLVALGLAWIAARATRRSRPRAQS